MVSPQHDLDVARRRKPVAGYFMGSGRDEAALDR